MSTAYQSAIPTYDGCAFNYCPSTTLAHAGRTKAMVDDTRSVQHRCLHASQTAQTRSGSHLASQLLHIADTSHRRPVTRPSTPPSQAASLVAHEDKEPSWHDSETLIYHSLQMPRCMSPDGGSLSDFAAQMTCFFWFDSADNLKRAEAVRSKSLNSPIPRLPHLAKPFEQFRKWVYNVLSTTQVTQNVIFLALLFIYRLKMSTPQIKGRAGSEYRLLTVALMLGNKFLDDNTYTNKTWAEVSSFAVQDIHVMEVEFLSNMRYKLLTSKSEWEAWLIKLACFHDFYERALKQPMSPTRLPTSKNLFHSPVPSPTATRLPITADMPSYTSSGPSAAAYSTSPASSKTFAAYQENGTSPLTSKQSMSHGATRKRTPEEDSTEHPAKRRVPGRGAHATPVTGLSLGPNRTTDASRLPVPQLTINTNQGRSLSGAIMAASGYPPQVADPGQHAISLPPLQAGMRAMSNIFPPGPSTTMAQQASIPAPNVPTTPFSVAPLTAHAVMPYGTPTKRHSPGRLASFGSSPMEHLGPGTAGIHTPISHTPMSNSPSVFLQQRASPYKPIRHVNTLLYPPPSASLDQYHLSVPVQPNQMHYQPLGRRHDVRKGVVPDFVVYNRGQQYLGSRGGQQRHYHP